MNSPWWRRSAIALGGLLLLLVAAAVVLVATFDAERYKALAIDWMKTEHQRTLAIDGPVSLSVFPRLAVEVEGLRLSEHARDDVFLAIDEAALSVRVLPLLKKQLVVDRVRARGVRAAYLRDAQGRRNIDDLLGGDGKPAPGTAAEGDAQALQLDVSEVQLDDVQLRVRDAMAPLAGELVLTSFRSGRLAPGVATPVALQARVQLTQPQAASVALALNGTLGWDGAALQAGPLKLSVESATFGAVTLAPSTLALDALRYSPETRSLDLKALQLALAGRQGEAPFEAALDWPQLSATAETLQGSALSGHFAFGGLGGTFRSQAPSGHFDALRLPGLALELKGQLGPRQLAGNAKADVLLQLARRAAALERLDLRATLNESGAPPLALSLAGQARGDADAAQWTLTGALNEARFESRGSAAFGGRVPKLDVEARFDRLDLNPFLTPEPAATPKAAGPADTPVQLDALNAVDGRFKLSAGALAVRQYRVTDARLEATLDGGTLRVRRLTGQAWGGRIDASGSAAARSQRMAVKLAANGVDVNALLNDVAGKDLLEGTGRVTADLHASGASVGALRSSLAGSTALQLRDGAVKGINLARALRQAKAALTRQADAVSQASATEKTDFSELSASATIADGVARSTDLDLKSPFLRIGGAGQFDIGRGTVDYIARTSVVASAAGQGSAELDALRGVTVPVRLSGPFDAIDWQIQWSAVAAAAVRNKLEEKLADKLGRVLGPPPAASAASAPASPEDQLKDRLKRLLR